MYMFMSVFISMFMPTEAPRAAAVGSAAKERSRGRG